MLGTELLNAVRQIDLGLVFGVVRLDLRIDLLGGTVGEVLARTVGELLDELQALLLRHEPPQ